METACSQVPMETVYSQLVDKTPKLQVREILLISWFCRGVMGKVGYNGTRLTPSSFSGFKPRRDLSPDK